MDKPAERNIKMKVLPFPFDTEKQGINIFVNKRFLKEQELSKGWNEYAIPVPEEFWRAGKNTIEFRYRFLTSPKEVLAGSTDERKFAVGVNYIKIEP